MSVAEWSVEVDGTVVRVHGAPCDADARREIEARVPGSVVHAADLPERDVAIADRGLTVSEGATRVALGGRPGPADIRRSVNALIGRKTLERGGLLVHATVAARGKRAVVILGGHGAGKTSVALRLRGLGFDLLAGDTALLGAGGRVTAGSRANLIRPGCASAGAFPPVTGLALPPGEVRLDAGDCAGGPYADVTIAAFAHVDVAGAPATRSMASEEIADLLVEAGSYAFRRRLSVAPHRLDWLLDDPVLPRPRAVAASLAGTAQGLRLSGDSDRTAQVLATVLMEPHPRRFGASPVPD